jgi:hypothetical protein
MRNLKLRKITILLQRLYLTVDAASLKMILSSSQGGFFASAVAAMPGWQYKKDFPSPSLFTLPNNGIVQQKVSIPD